MKIKALFIAPFLAALATAAIADSVAIGNSANIPMGIPYATVNTACPGPGASAFTTSGLILTCQGGLWKGVGASLGATWSKTHSPGMGWVPLTCPDGYVMTSITAPMEDWKIVNCRQLN